MILGGVTGDLEVSRLLALAEEASGSKEATGSEMATGVGSAISLVTEAAVASLSRTRTWYWCHRMTVPSPNWIQADTEPVFSTKVPGIHVFFYRKSDLPPGSYL